MRTKKFFKFCIGVVLGISAWGITAQAVRATDIPIFPTGPVYQLRGLVWGTSVQPGFNNNYFFTPLSQSESVCVYVKNNNTTNPHPFIATIAVTSDPSNITPSDGTWQSVASSGLTAPVSPGITAGIGVSTSGVSLVSINLSASTTLGGSPETANLSIIQTSGNCASGNNFIGSAPNTVSASIPFQSISDGLSQSFSAISALTNPIANVIELHVNANGGARTLYFDHVVISCSATCTPSVIMTTTVGTGCAVAPLVSNMKIGSTVTSTAIVNGNAAGSVCAVAPAFYGGVIGTIQLAANTPITVDLRGVIAPSGTTNGVYVNQIAPLTGTITATIFWYEK